jgi:hypothetical protein
VRQEDAIGAHAREGPGISAIGRAGPAGGAPWGPRPVPWGFNPARKAGQVINRATADRRQGLAQHVPLHKPHRRQDR